MQNKEHKRMLEQDTTEMYSLSEPLDHSNYCRGHGITLTVIAV